MSSVVKRSVSLPADMWLATRRGLRSVRTWQRRHGALTAEEAAAADLALDRVGVGRNR